MKHTTRERIDQLEEAQGLLEEALRLVKQAVRGTGFLEDRARAYLIPSLAMCISGDHGYLGGQPCNLAEMIQDLRKEADGLDEIDRLIDEVETPADRARYIDDED
jgi:hypothetical protein